MGVWIDAPVTGTVEGVCTKFTGNENIFSIAQKSAELLIDTMFVELAGIF